MASRQDFEGARTTEELEGMLQASPKRTAKHWRWLCLTTVVLGVVAVGLGQAGMFARQENPSLLQRITMVHDKIHTIVAAAMAKGEFNASAKTRFLVDAFSKKGNPPNAMGFTAVMKHGGKGKVEKAVFTLAAIKGEGAALKKRVEDIRDIFLDGQNHFKESIDISQDGDSVTLDLKLPFTHSENDELDDSFEDIKPEFHAKLALGRDFQHMQNLEYKSVVWAPGGIDINFDAVFGSAVFDVAEELSGIHNAKDMDMMKFVRLFVASGEMYYKSEDELEKSLQGAEQETLESKIPTICKAMTDVCGMLPKKDPMFDVTDVLAGVQKLDIQGLPGGWDVVVNFDNFNPAPVSEHCLSNYNCTKEGDLKSGGRKVRGCMGLLALLVTLFS